MYCDSGLGSWGVQGTVPAMRRGWRAQPAPTTRPLGPRYDRRGAQGREHGAQGAAAGWGAGHAAWAGQDCALGAPDLIFKPVFDSVFFLSQ